MSRIRLENINIYYADDDLDDAFLFKNALKEIGINCSLSTYTSGIELINNLKNISTHPHIVFLDLNMPLKNGLECLSEIKQNEGLNNISIIIISTSSSEVFKEKAIKLGAFDYIQKPSTFNELKEKIKTAITSAIFDIAV
ncbi:MAG: response regulator [Bacteroidetes bacterium]|nr:response regulator [Bacteroidota bacterium]